MAESHTPFASERELEELRTQIRQLREEQKSANGNGHKAPAAPPEEESKDKKEEDEGKKPHPVRNAILIVVAAILVVGAVIWWLNSRKYESTDDAQVDGHISGIAARVSGTVAAVYVEENQFVRAGQVLVDLDPRDYEVAVQQARSQLSQAQAQTRAEQPNVPVTQVTSQTGIATASANVAAAQSAVLAAQRDYEAAAAKIAEAQANSAKAQADVERYRPLVEKDEVPRQQFDQAIANAKALAATVTSNQATAEAALRQVDQRRAELTEAQRRYEEAQTNAPNQVAIQRANVATRQAGIQAAQAQLNQALLNLSYAKIVAPVDGVVAKRTAEVGQHLAPGQQVMLITQTNDLWVTANFRETQLRQMRPGQSVRIHIDAFDADFDGYVDSMPAATGAVTSLLPPENATGNYVKVVQRLPVRIRFKPNQQGLERLRPGMSAEPKVRL